MIGPQGSQTVPRQRPGHAAFRTVPVYRGSRGRRCGPRRAVRPHALAPARAWLSVPSWAPQPLPWGDLIRPPSWPRGSRKSSPCPFYVLLVEISRVEVRGIVTCLLRRALRRTSRRNRLPVVPPRNTPARPNTGCTSGSDQAFHSDEYESPIEASAKCRSEASVYSPEVAPTARQLRNRLRPNMRFFAILLPWNRRPPR
jgi:hypothetical protein